MLSNGSDFHFIFIVDRSGSMRGYNRLVIAKEAMNLFVKSLPIDCSFSMIGFGCKYEVTQHNGQQVLSYNDETMDAALNEIDSF